jgi:hypothetical protein
VVQERDGQDDRILIWTETLGNRKDCFPISKEEALEYLIEMYPDNYERVEGAAPVIEDPAIETEQTGEGVINEATEFAKDDGYVNAESFEQPAPKTDPKNAIAFDVDSDPEILMVRSFRSKNQVELFLLGKGIEVTNAADKKLELLKADAESAIIASRMENNDG